MDELVKWIVGGGLVGVVSAWAAMRIERWKIQRESQREARSASQEADASFWKRTTELMASMQIDLKETKIALALEQADCKKRIDAVRAESQADYDQSLSKIKVLSKICLDQQLELDKVGIEVSRLQRERELAGLPGGRRSSDTTSLLNPRYESHSSIMPDQPNPPGSTGGS